MKKIFSIVICLVLGVGSMWAETYSVSPEYNYEGTAEQYVNNFNFFHGTYVTLSKSTNATMKTSYIRPSGSGENKTQTGYIKLTAASGTYIRDFSTILGGSSNGSRARDVVLRWHEAPTYGSTVIGTFSKWKEYDSFVAKNGTVEASLSDQELSALSVYTGYSDGGITAANYAHLQDVTTTIWIPEVVLKADGQTAPENYSESQKPVTKGVSITFAIEYNVKHAIKNTDFTAVIHNFQGKGTLSCSKVELLDGANAENKILKVTCQYTAANEDDFATNYSADLVISSKNTVNTNTFTTHITGTAGTIKANNELKWIISGPYYVNTTIDNPTFTNSDAPITYDSSDPSVAEFVDGKLVLKSAGITTLSAIQVETEEIKASNCEDITITVEKRTPSFTIYPGEEVYTSLTYVGYITPANDPNGTMNPTYQSLDEMLFTVDADGNLTTNAGLGTATLQAVVESTDEWIGGTYSFTVNIVRDPIHVDLCLNEDLMNNPNFVVKTEGEIVGWKDGALKMGTSHSTSNTANSITMHVTGSLSHLQIDNITATSTVNSISFYQSVDNEEWELVQTLTAVGSNLSYELNPESQYIKIEFSGNQTISIYGLCITERVGASIIPDPVELVLMNGVVIDASFTASVSNLTELKLQLDSDDFILVRDGKTYDTSTNTLLLDYTDGLGIDKNVSAAVTVQYVGDLASAKDKTCTLSALDENDVVQATAVVKITEIASVGDLPGVIIPTNAGETGIYTGTEMGAGDGGAYESFPYRKKTQVDLTKTFDEDGNALFDILYIFGLTTETDETHDNINLPSKSLACNAKTFCYVYHKSTDGKKYEFNTLFDAVSTRFDHGENMNGKHLYFTGYCPFANIGVNPADEGWMYFQGGNTSVDIYLDNCTILGRYRTTSGGYYGFTDITNNVILEASSLGGNNENINYMSGFSSIFVFNSSSNDYRQSYKPTIHIAGDNHLKGQLGYISKVIGRVTMLGDLINTEVETGIGKIYTVSSPITIKPDDTGGYTDLTMDDLWPTNANHTTKEVTNGFLRLDAYSTSGSICEKVPSVDLGSEYGSLTINGGQYMLRNSAADGTYTCNLAFSYRKFSKLAQREALGIQVEALLSLYGFGGDETLAPVTINSGTFNMYKNMYYSGVNNQGDTTYLGSNYYIDQDSFLDLRLPAGDNESGRLSSINGGTFNGISHVVFCSKVTSSGKSPINKLEDALCLQDVVIDGQNLDQNNGTVEFTIPEPFSDAYDEDDTDKVGYNLATGLNAVASCELYGGQSANSYTKNIGGEDKDVVSILLPAVMCEDADCTDCELFEEAIYYNWVTAIPKFNVSVEGQEVTVGGDVEVPTTEGGEIKYVVNQMLYTDLEGMEEAAITGDVTIGFADNTSVRGQFTNTNNYRIYKNLNVLKNVKADRWYCFVAPYDIHEISVLETSESELSKEQYKNDREAAIALQAENNLRMLYGLSNFVLPDPNGRASSLTLNQLLKSRLGGVSGLKRIPLYHYNGKREADANYGRPVMTANYYLYEVSNSGFDKTSTTNDKDTFLIDWTPVSRGADEPLMRQGQVYAIQFPWCPMCNDWEDRTYYDYWTGKLVLFYGRGYDNAGTENDGQLIYGISGQTTLNAIPTAGQAVYAGNYSLADMSAPSNAYVHDYDVDGATNPADWFIAAPNDHVVNPTEGFMLYNAGSSAMPARISRKGQIVYPDNTTTDTEGVPTIGERTSLMLFAAEDGFEVLSLCEQLVTVYNLQGNVVFQQYMTAGEQMYVGTGAGIFVVRGESETIKVMVD